MIRWVSIPHKKTIWKIFYVKPFKVQKTFTTTKKALTITRAAKTYCTQRLHHMNVKKSKSDDAERKSMERIFKNGSEERKKM